jgi:microcystin degradation protein MlrC
MWYAGRSVVLLVNNVTLIATSRAVSLYDRSLFYAHGQDPRRFDLVVVKSPHCQPHMFRDWATRYIDVDAPGATSANLRSLGHTRCPRPIFPLDDDVPWQPKVALFRRP